MRFYKSISNFFFDPLPVLPLGIYRIIFGTFFLLYLINIFPLYSLYYSDNGYMVGPSGIEVSTWNTSRYFDMWPSPYYYLSEDQLPIKVLYVVLVLFTILFIFGIWTNLAALLMYGLWYSIALRNGLAHDGEDGMMRFVLVYAIFIPYGRSLSLSNYLRRRRGLQCRDTFVPFVFRLLQINVALIYFFSVLYKMVDDFAWVDGTALYYTALNTRWGLSPGGIWVATMFGGWLIPILTYWTLFCEAFFVLFVWFKKTRLIACLLLLQLHFGIAMCLESTTWFNIAAILNIPLFLKKEDYLFLLSIFYTFFLFLRSLGNNVQVYFKRL